jgi:hypothetical protein
MFILVFSFEYLCDEWKKVLPSTAITKKTMSTPDLVSAFASDSVSGSSTGRPDGLTNGVRSSMAVGCR